MLVDKPRGTWVVALVNTAGKASMLHYRCGLTHSPCGHFLNCRDKICATPNTLSGKLLQGTAVSFHVSLVIFLPKRRAVHFSPVKGLAAISCRCRTSEPLEMGGQLLLFRVPRPHRCRHGRAFGIDACCDGSSRAAMNKAHVISRLVRLSRSTGIFFVAETWAS